MSNLREYINNETLIKDEIYKNFEYSLTCNICQDIMIDPMMCMNCQAVYCQKCIEDWLKKSNSCTNRCKNINFKKSILSQNFLSKLKFICKNCEKVLDYDDVKQHSLTKCKNDSKIKLLKASEIMDESMPNVNSKKKIY